MTFEEIKALGGILVYPYVNSPFNDVWEEIPLSRVKALSAEAEETMREIERYALFEKSRYERAKLRKQDIETGFQAAGQTGRWFWAADPQTLREFFAVTRSAC